VKWFDNRRGWGFLVLADGREAFVHHTHLVQRGYRTLRPDRVVECDVVEGERGLEAARVRMVEPDARA
jgi:CspA family cold shock protein